MRSPCPASFVGRLADHHIELSRKCHPLVGSASLTVTRMNGGLADNIVPAHCDIVIDRRVLPSESMEDVRAELKDILAKAENRPRLQSGYS